MHFVGKKRIFVGKKNCIIERHQETVQQRIRLQICANCESARQNSAAQGDAGPADPRILGAPIADPRSANSSSASRAAEWLACGAPQQMQWRMCGAACKQTATTAALSASSE